MTAMGSFRWAARQRGAIISVAVAALLAGQVTAPAGAIAGAGQKWSVQPTPNARVANGQLAADSCTGPAWCVAVGSTTDSMGRSALAEAWNGTSWRVMAVPVPPGGTHSALAGVSCTAATACTAVGNYISNQRSTSPWPSGGTARRGRCSARPARPPRPIAPSTRSRADRPRRAPPSGTTTSEPTARRGWRSRGTGPAGRSSRPRTLRAPSTACLTACPAPQPRRASPWGTTSAPGPTTGSTLAESWDGSTWTVTVTPNPARSIVSRLYGVSCSSAADCTAVGDWIKSATGHSGSTQGSPLAVTLAEVWNGTRLGHPAHPQPRRHQYRQHRLPGQRVVPVARLVHRGRVLLRCRGRRHQDAERGVERHRLGHPAHP